MNNKMKALQLQLCDIQDRLFVLSGTKGYDSVTFIKSFMKSDVAKGLDSKYNRMQWAGEEYLLFWHFNTGEDSKGIYKQAPAETMSRNWLIFHTLAPEVAIADLKELYKQRNE